MKGMRWSLGLLGLICATVPASAQGYFFANPNGYDYGFPGSTFTYTQRRHHSSLSISFGLPGFGPIFPGLLVPVVYGPVVNQQVTVVTYRPPPPPPLVVGAPFVFDDLTLAILPRREPEIPLNPRPLPPKKLMQPEPAPAPRQEQPKPPPPKPPDIPRVPHPNPEPGAESARLIHLGKEAFADTDYGLAAQRFRQATVVLPNDSQSQFLLAQALFALGKFQDAVDAIDLGMAIEPNWPALNFRPLELYGTHVAFYPDHLGRLEDVAKRFPNDPVVLFLLGYELWFDGRKDEARDQFRAALPAGADPIVIDRFLRALPPGGGV
jgi:Tetratricopeptide repeat